MSEPTLRDVLAPIVRDLLGEARPTEPLMISQLNAEPVFGISSRMHLEYCRRKDFTPRVVRAGKLRLVDASEYRAWLRATSQVDPARAPVDPDDGAGVVLAELGMRTRGESPARRRGRQAAR